MSGPVWVYTPVRHKTAWKGKTRTVLIGPKAQELIAEYFTDDPSDYLFSPQRAVEELLAARAARRETPQWPSHLKRNETKRVGARRKRPPAAKYNRLGYLTAVTRACDKAFPLPAHLVRRKGEAAKVWAARLTSEQKAELAAWRKAHRRHPNQLRHTYATKVRKAHGLEAAQVLLGHLRADVTQVYAERNQELAEVVAAKIG